ncbi:hypothetical protein SAMN05892883_1594 [Jatrophihabitans sp. GAS493]|uniref:hypothetical protein n=1 Tax=Jatrophihabitans sp. GAS493 TaxID=1907575 RepID=UPI000BC0C1C6|nr:hypothetical protein [Jatrophihabitans sp. GAS493]SOD72170.1 hypothetical protein SAMN05892883_1594 [Jatrophihabitans sp. GAS493]
MLGLRIARTTAACVLGCIPFVFFAVLNRDVVVWSFSAPGWLALFLAILTFATVCSAAIAHQVLCSTTWGTLVGRVLMVLITVVSVPVGSRAVGLVWAALSPGGVVVTRILIAVSAVALTAVELHGGEFRRLRVTK